MEKEAGKPVNLRDTVKIKGIKHETDKKQHLTPGQEYKVHPDVAKNLVETGHAELVDKPAKK